MSRVPVGPKTAPTQSGENICDPSPNQQLITVTGSLDQTTGEMGIGTLPVQSVKTGPVNSINTGTSNSREGSVVGGDMSMDHRRGKSAEHAHTSKHQSASTTAHSPYHSGKHKSSHTRNKKARKPKFKVTNIADRFKTAIMVLLVLVTAVNVALCTLAIHKAINNLLSVPSTWKLREQPRVISAERYLIASTSETCNEIAKGVQTKENVSIAVLASIMTACLSLAEPHNSGVGGHSIALYVDAKNDVCKQTQGHYRLPWDLSQMEKALNEGEPNDFWGPFSVAVPGHARTMIGLLQIDDDIKNTTDTLYTYFSNYLKHTLVRHTMNFPVSLSMGHAIVGSGNDALFTFLKAFKNMRDSSLKVLVAGDNFEAHREVLIGYIEAIEEIRNTLEGKEDDEINEIRKIGGYAIRLFALLEAMAQAGHDGNLIEEFNLWKITEENSRLIDGKKTEINGHTVCTANLPTSSSFLIDALKKNEKAFKKFEKYHIDTQERRNIYETMYYTLNDTVNMFRDWDKIKGFGLDESDHSSSVDMKPTLMRIAEILKSKKSRQASHGTYGANMFVIIDVVNQKAVSMVASLGDSMGSLLADIRGYYLLNNLLSGFADVNEVGPVVNSLQPMIAMKNKTISLATAGCGGVLTRTLDLARTLAVAVLKLLYDTSIQRAVSIPLIYPYLDRGEHTPDFPWNDLAEIIKSIEKRVFGGKDEDGKRKFLRSVRTDLDVVTQRLDRAIVASSDGKTAEGLYYDQGSAQMLPMGF